MLSDLFHDEQLVLRIQSRLPKLFQMAEIESSRAGKVGMEVGSLRERIIVALLIYAFGKENVKTEVAITAKETDVFVFSSPVSIKTITGARLSGVKLIWTVDSQKASEFMASYKPLCDILLVQINWQAKGGIYYLPKSAQDSVFEALGSEKFMILPKRGTNPRGVEFSNLALENLANHHDSLSIQIEWQKSRLQFDPFARWLELWESDE